MMDTSTEAMNKLMDRISLIDNLNVYEIDEAINARKDILMSLPEGSDEYLDNLGMIGDLHVARFKQLPQSLVDLDEAIDLWREFCRICPHGSIRRLMALDKFSGLLQQRKCDPKNLMEGFLFLSAVFSRGRMPDGVDLDEAIAVRREALKICPVDHEMHSSMTVKLGSLLLARTDGILDLREAIRLLNSVMNHRDWISKGVRRYILLNNLAYGLTSLVGAVARDSVKNEVEQLIKLHWELAADYAGEMGPAVSFWEETAKWLQRICEPPLRCYDRAPELAKVAKILLSFDPNNMPSKRLLITSDIAMEYLSGSVKKITAEEPDHESYLSHFKQFVTDERIATKGEKIVPLYKEYIQETSEIISHICKNLKYLCFRQQQNRAVDDTYIIALINIAALCHLQQVQLVDSKFFDAALNYQLYLKQYVGPGHDFFNSLQPALSASLGRKYNITDDLRDYELHVRDGFEMGVVRPSIGPSMLQNPWEDTLEPFNSTVAPEEENARFLVEYASTKVSSARTADSLYYLAERLLVLTNTFLPQDTKYLEQATLLLDEIESLDPEKLTGWQVNHASIALSWFGYTGNLSYLDKALAMPITNRISYIKVLLKRFQYTGNMNDLEEAIALADKGSRYKKKSTLLGMCLNTKYYMTGHVQDLQACLANPKEDIDEAEAYLYRYERFGHAEDLDRAFYIGSLGKKDELLETDEIYDDNKRDILHCKGLLARYNKTSDSDLLTTALTTIENTITRSLHIMLPHVLHCQASILLTMKDSEIILNQALDIQRKALNSLPESNIYYPSLLGLLGKIYYEKYHFSKDKEDLISCISTLKKAVKHQNVYLSTHQLNLGLAIQLYSEEIDIGKSIEDAMVQFRNSATSPIAPLQTQYMAAMSWAKAAEEIDIQEALYAYEYLMDVLPQLASLGLDIKDRHTTVANLTNGVAGDAAAFAITHGFIEKAVEFLEHGRSIFWQQLLQLHSSMSEIKQLRPDLAEQLSNLARDLNISSFRTNVDDVSERYKDYLARESQKRRDLDSQWNELVKEARSVPGCEDLFQPPLYSKLASAAENSIVVLLSTTTDSAHAIIMKDKKSPPQAVQLPEMNRKYAQNLSGLLQLTLSSGSRQARDVIKPIERQGKLLKPFNIALEEKRMFTLLSELWNKIVKPVIKALKLMPSVDPPRITWCCSDVLAILPIHAAGLYQGTIRPISLTDFAISSYTPTLSNIISDKTPTFIKNPEVLLAGLEESPGYPPLPKVLEELSVVEKTLRKLSGGTVVKLIGNDATGNNTLSKLSSAHLVHLACHGAAFQNPLESALILYDGELKIEKLIRTPFINAKLAFLSACQTAKINPEEPDESIHISAAMLNTGFKSVIGTMWSIDDSDAPLISRAFYEYLITENGEINLASSASALHKAVKEFKAAGISPLRWAPFIHIGL